MPTAVVTWARVKSAFAYEEIAVDDEGMLEGTGLAQGGQYLLSANQL